MVFLLDYCSHECIVLIYYFCCSGLFGCIALDYNSVTVSVYGSGGLMFVVYSGVVLFHWFYCSGLFGFAVLVYFGSIVSVSSSRFIRIVVRFLFR